MVGESGGRGRGEEEMLEEAIRMCDRTNRIQRKRKMKEKLGHDRKAEGRKCQRRPAREGGGWGLTDRKRMERRGGEGRKENVGGKREGREMKEGRGRKEDEMRSEMREGRGGKRK